MSSTSHYIFPDQVFAGFDSIQTVGTHALAEGARHIFLLADPGVAKAGLHTAVLRSLQSSGIAVTIYDRVTPNPDTHTVDQAVAAYRASDADMIIGIGGGSALDTAKAARLVAAGPADGKVAEYAFRAGDKALPHPKLLPAFFAIPTTAGTGAEVTPWAVITDPVDKVKFGVGGPHSVPTIAFVDPGLMMGMPPQLSAATGMDAITHLIEAYASTNHNPVLDPMILAAISSAASALPVAVLKGENARAREAMANAALVGGIAISSKWLGACHSLAHQLSGFANVPHGLANAIMLPHVMAFNLPAAVERYADIGVALGASTTGTLRQRADAAIQLIHQLNRDIGLPATLRAAGVDAVLIPAMAKAALTLDLNWWTNPRSVDETTMARLYHEAL